MVTRKISTVKYGVLICKIWSCAVNAKLRDSLVFSLMKIYVYILRRDFGFIDIDTLCSRFVKTRWRLEG